MKTLGKIARKMSLNMLWVAMFLPLWSVEDHFLFRLLAANFGAWVLAVFQVLFEE